MALSRPVGASLSPLGGILAWQVALGLTLLCLWEWAGRAWGPTWISQPTLIAARLASLGSGDLYRHLTVTVTEIVAGLTMGAAMGVIGGVGLGCSRVIGTIVRPMIVTLYNVPLVTLAPLFILWFGFGMESKIVLISISVFFIVFFNAYSGAQRVDRDTQEALAIMGATPREIFRKVILPGCMTWIIAGLKIALPYSLVAAVTAEMLAARDGLGSLLAKAAGQFDMTGVYAVLFILMLMGMVVSEAALRIERLALRWRHASP